MLFLRAVVVGIILLFPIPPLFAQEPATREEAAEMARAFNEAMRRQDYKQAIEVGLKLAERMPKDSELAYNLACAYALEGNKAEGLKWLKTSADHGMSELTLITTDADLTSLRDDPTYREIVEAVRSNHAKAFEEVKRLAAEAKPQVILPPGHDPSRPAPLLVALHGYGDEPQSISEIWEEFAKEIGAIILAPRAVHRVRGAGWQWGEAEDADYVVKLAIEQVRREHKIREDRIVLTGFSQGGFMSFNLGVRNPQLFRGVIPVAGQYDPAVAPPPDKSASPKVRFFIMVGSKDNVLESNREAAKRFEEAGIPVELVVYENVGHDFPAPIERPTEMRRAMKFIFGD